MSEAFYEKITLEYYIVDRVCDPYGMRRDNLGGRQRYKQDGEGGQHLLFPTIINRGIKKMAIRIREIDNVNIIDVEGRIDINSSDIIETVGWLVNTGKVNIILNLENVDLVDYNGLSILAITYKNILNHKGKFRLLHVPLSVAELFKVVKLDAVFEAYSDEEAAVHSFFEADTEKIHLRRKFTRLDIHLTVKYTVTGSDKSPKSFTGQVLNISAAGLYIYTTNTLPINTALDLEFSLPHLPAALVANGRVVWLADKEIQPHAYPGMGVAFAHLTSDKEKAIIDFIDKNITHRADFL